MSAFGKRLVRAGSAELTVDVRKVFGEFVSTALPHPGFQRTRTALLRATGIRIGARSAFLGPLRLTGPGATHLLSIGEDTLITGDLHVDLGAPVHIGGNVRIGHQVQILTIDHEIGPKEHRCGEMVAAPVSILDGAWLASRVTVLPGVTVGAGAIVGAGAVVTRDVPPNTLVAGVPARHVRDLPHDVPRGTRRRLAIAASL